MSFCTTVRGLSVRHGADRVRVRRPVERGAVPPPGMADGRPRATDGRAAGGGRALLQGHHRERAEVVPDGERQVRHSHKREVR